MSAIKKIVAVIVKPLTHACNLSFLNGLIDAINKFAGRRVFSILIVCCL